MAHSGHCNVPIKYPADKALGAWVQSQRNYYHRYKVTPSVRSAARCAARISCAEPPRTRRRRPNLKFLTPTVPHWHGQDPSALINKARIKQLDETEAWDWDPKETQVPTCACPLLFRPSAVLLTVSHTPTPAVLACGAALVLRRGTTSARAARRFRSLVRLSVRSGWLT